MFSLDRLRVRNPGLYMWIRPSLTALGVLFVVSCLFLIIQYSKGGWPFESDSVVDRTFRADTSTIENLLANGNARQLKIRADQLQDDPDKSITERLAFLDDRIKLLEKIKYLDPTSKESLADLITSLTLKEEFSFQLGDLNLSNRLELKSICEQHLKSNDSNLAKVAVVGDAVANIAGLLKDYWEGKSYAFDKLVKDVEKTWAGNSSNETLAEALQRWSLLFDEKMSKADSKKFREMLISKFMMSSFASIRGIGGQLSIDYQDSSVELPAAEEYTLHAKTEIAENTHQFLQQASADRAVSEVQVERAIDLVDQLLMMGRFETAEACFAELSALKSGKWSDFEPEISETLLRLDHLGQEIDLSCFENLNGPQVSFDSTIGNRYRLIYFVTADSYRQSAKRFIKIINSFTRENWQTKTVQFAIVFLDEGDADALAAFSTNPASKIGLESWKVVVGSDKWNAWHKRLPIPEPPCLLVLDEKNRLKLIDPNLNILKELKYEINFKKEARSN